MAGRNRVPDSAAVYEKINIFGRHLETSTVTIKIPKGDDAPDHWAKKMSKDLQAVDTNLSEMLKKLVKAIPGDRNERPDSAAEAMKGPLPGWKGTGETVKNTVIEIKIPKVAPAWAKTTNAELEKVAKALKKLTDAIPAPTK